LEVVFHSENKKLRLDIEKLRRKGKTLIYTLVAMAAEAVYTGIVVGEL